MVPAFVSLLCICIVFVPMFFLQGVARFLFVPLAEAVVFAMIWSFILSRTLVPTMAMYLLQPHVHHSDQAARRRRAIRWSSCNAVSRRGFERFRSGYRDLLSLTMQHRKVFMTGSWLLSPRRSCWRRISGGTSFLRSMPARS